MNNLKERLQTHLCSLSVAESLTGGLLSAAIVEISGISKYYRGGVTTYALKSKEDLLRVPLSHTQKTDAVDEYTAKSMAKGVTSLFHSDIGLATTGIAERRDEREEQAFVALYDARNDAVFVHHLCFGETIIQEKMVKEQIRPFVRNQVTQFALNFLVDYLSPKDS